MSKKDLQKKFVSFNVDINFIGEIDQDPSASQ